MLLFKISIKLYKMSDDISESTRNMVEIYKKYKLQINTIVSICTIILLLQGNILDMVLTSYMGYKTLSTIDNNDDNNKLKITLKMWGCYSVCNLLEKFMSIINILYPISIVYYIGKLGIFFWLFSSDENLDSFYNLFIQLAFNKYKKVINSVVSYIKVYCEITIGMVLDITKNIQDNVLVTAIDRIDDNTLRKIKKKLNETNDETDKDK